MDYYNRYKDFIINGQQTVVPFLSIPGRVTDQQYLYRQGRTRLDKISFERYGTPYFGWLILASNPIYGGDEWSIPDAAILTIPFPLVSSLQEYKSQLDNHFYYYGR